MARTLFIVATPIGNLKDITIRALETLNLVDFVACEDTRQTAKLMAHHQIRKPLVRYDENVHDRAAAEILDRLSRGQSGALVTDAGTPAISDPGADLVQAVIKAGFSVVPIPGPSAPIAALSAAGFGKGGFVFLGFLPRRNSRAERTLREALRLGKTVVIFESPFRLVDLLDLTQKVDPEANVVVARELTKIHEEFVRGSVAEVRSLMLTRPTKGEAVVLINPGPEVLDENEEQ